MSANSSSRRRRRSRARFLTADDQARPEYRDASPTRRKQQLVPESSRPMKIDRQSRQSAKRYFRACRKADGSVDETAVREIIQLLVDQKPRNYLAVMTPALPARRAGAGGEHGADRKRHAPSPIAAPASLPAWSRLMAALPAPHMRKIRRFSAACAFVAATISGTVRSAAG